MLLGLNTNYLKLKFGDIYPNYSEQFSMDEELEELPRFNVWIYQFSRYSRRSYQKNNQQ